MQALERHLPELIFWAGVLSLVSLLALLVAVPWVVARLPQDYFSAEQRHSLAPRSGPPEWLLSAAKNLLGALLLVLGVIMLFTPGQGLLTILVGLLLMNFPGKYRLERALVAQPKVLDALNWMRRRRDLPPFDAPR